MRWITACVLLSIGLLQAREVSACSCQRTSTETAIKESAAVFSGRVIEVERNDETPFGGLKATFEVAEIWKGIDEPLVSAVTASNSAACGYPFAKGEEYLIYAYRDRDGTLRVSLCSHTKPLAEAETDLNALGKSSQRFDKEKSAAATAEKKKRGCSAVFGATDATPIGWVTIAMASLLLLQRRRADR